MARPMQRIGTGSPKEDIVAKLMRTALLIGLAVTWHPDAAAGQYSWSTFSVSVGSGGFGLGASYTAVDPWYDFYYVDPCWDYAYYDWYPPACPFGYDRFHLRQSYSVFSVHRHPPHRWQSYYPPYGYYGYPSYSGFSISLGLNFGYGYPSRYYGPDRYALFYPGYGYSPYGYGYDYGYPAYGVVRYGGSRTASRVFRPAPAYQGSPLVRSGPLYKESPRGDVQRTATARSISSGATTATRSISDRRARTTPAAGSTSDRTARASNAPQSVRGQAPQTQARSTRVAALSGSQGVRSNPARSNSVRSSTARASSGVAGQRTPRARPSDAIRRGAPTRLYSPSRATTPRVTRSENRSTRNDPIPNARTRSARTGRESRAEAPARSRTPTSSQAARRPTARSGSEAVTRSAPTRTRAPVARAAPSTRPRAQATRSTSPRATAQRSRASSPGAARGAGRARANPPARRRSPQR